MGGPGSGAKWDKKGTVEDHLCLDVRKLQREHGVKPGDQMTVQYQWRREQMTQEVMVDWTACNFGGYRPWLICMNCGRRVAVIYLKGKYFACRHCYNLTYTSCQGLDSRFSKFLRNYDGSGSGGAEDLPLYALKGFFGRERKEKKRLIKELDRRRRGRPSKRASEG